jgi:hypothetical protein
VPIACLVASLLTGSILVGPWLPGAALPVVLALVPIAWALALQRIDRWHQPPLTSLERELTNLGWSFLGSAPGHL